VSDYLDALAEFASTMTLNDVPDAVCDAATWQILDTLGVIVGGTRAEPVRRMAARLAEDGPCHGLGLGVRFRPRQAALVHGTAGTWLDFDVGHRWSGGHPAIHVLPAALALAESRGRSGEDLLTAFIVGSEVACRIGLAKGPLAQGLHPHGTWPVIGAVAGAGRLFGLTPDEIRRAMDLASTLTLTTSWNTAFSGATVRNTYAGLGAELAIAAIEWLLADWDGEHDGVGVVFGSIAASGINRRRATVGLGSEWEFATTYFKPYPFARFGHNAIDVLIELRAQHGFEAGEVERITAKVGALGGRMNNPDPQNELQARFSTPHAVAVLLTRGEIRPDDFTGDALTDPALRELASRVTVEEDPTWEALSPRWRGATVEVVLRDGTVLVGETEQTLGDPEEPLSAEALTRKFDDLVAPVVGDMAAAEARTAILDIAGLPNVAPIVEPLAGGQ
jgi:2-methylcitrate dehydratase PrpD